MLLPSGATAKPSPEPFEIIPGSFHLTPSTTHAAAHEDLTTSFDFAHDETKSSRTNTHNDVRTVIVNFPPGFNGNNTAVPTCTDAQLLGGSNELPGCPLASQVGTVSFEADSLSASAPAPAQFTVPIYNMEVTSFGVAAEFGFKTVIFTQTLTVSVRPGDSGLTATTPDIPKTEPRNVSVTIWGLPASHAHDAQRGATCGQNFELPPICTHTTGPGGPQEAGIPVRPFLSNPTGCEPHFAEIEAYSWEQPEAPSVQRTEVAPIDECERVPFSPEIEVQPTTNSAESPSGLDVSLLVPQSWDNPFSLSTANLRDAVVTLPAGYSLNPSAGSGLGVCTEAQLAEETYDSRPSVGCPAESRIGSVLVETPILTEKAEGSVYVAKPFDNPFHSLLALYMLAKVPDRGVIVKVAGVVHPDPVTGQLTTTFRENPQQPFNKFTLKFRQGATSPLVSPPVCGKYAAEANLSPWSAPESFQHLLSEFEIEHGIGGGPCPSGGTPPFHPGLVAGTINNRAGSYSPFYVRLSRNDGEQEITHFSIKLPPGVIGKLAGVASCSDAAIAQAKSLEHEGDAALEQASPSCPANSEVGHTLVEAGVGSVLAQAPGKVYLAGPYHGSQLSLVSITAARVGPFDLGTVVVRFALKIDPETAEVSVDGATSDPIPHIIDGIPVHLRNIRTYVDRPNFVLNPTSCKPTSTASTVLGSGKDFTSAADDVPVTVSSPFQAADCASLGFAPRLALSLSGGKTHRGGLPAFKAVLTYPKKGAYANIAKAQVTLPSSEILEQGHLEKVCRKSIFVTGNVPGENCPASSIYGRARAITPLLDEPLEGPVYLRTGYGTVLPELTATLNNGQIHILLAGKIDSLHHKGSEISRIRNTFEAVPDAPVSKFVLEMKGGDKGLLVNNTNICKGTHKALAAFTGQNGKRHEFEPVLKATTCGKKGAGKKGKKSSKRLARLISRAW